MGERVSANEQKTVRVRIAVAVDPYGEWNACGWGKASQRPDANDEGAMESAADTVGAGEARFFIEVTLPIPHLVTITDVEVAEVKVADGYTID